jgi:asparagine synthase (glutamine-hydrolysing)
MCGICGFIRFDRKVDEGDRQIVDGMNRTLYHRGPDAQDSVIVDNVALGFSRLSIIGLGNGMQPIANEDGSLLLICNGEIFNYIELRKELRGRGHVFATESDVEVILHLYEEYGTDFLEKLNGQFAFALYDKTQRILFCARDQMGIIPFFYTRTGNLFIFGSEIKAILGHPAVVRTVDRVGLDQVFTFAGLISPRTLFEGIHSLENGHFLVVDELGGVTDREYWDLVYPEGPCVMNGKPEAYYIQQLEECLDASVNLRLRADVPTGFYLSGGLDSSIVAMKIGHLAPDGGRMAFSIDFAESQYSESPYQQLVAAASNSRLYQKVFCQEDIIRRLEQAIYHCECPIKETYNTASLALSEAVRAKGIKVVLSGEGADEFFAGYVGYRFDKMRAMNLSRAPADTLEEALRMRLWGDPSFYYERNFLEFDKEKQSLYSADTNADFQHVNCLNHKVVNRKRLDNRNVLHKRAYIDYKLRLVDHLVSDHGDRMAMANSVEARYPFLDKDLVAFSTTLPSDLKLKDFTEKYILKRMASRFVPKAVTDREKFHFIAPGSPYLLQQDISYINDILSYDTIRRQGFFDPDAVQRLKNIYSQPGFTVNAPYESDLLIIIITFGILLDKFFKL